MSFKKFSGRLFGVLKTVCNRNTNTMRKAVAFNYPNFRVSSKRGGNLVDIHNYMGARRRYMMSRHELGSKSLAGFNTPGIFGWPYYRNPGQYESINGTIFDELRRANNSQIYLVFAIAHKISVIFKRHAPTDSCMVHANVARAGHNLMNRRRPRQGIHHRMFSGPRTKHKYIH